MYIHMYIPHGQSHKIQLDNQEPLCIVFATCMYCTKATALKSRPRLKHWKIISNLKGTYFLRQLKVQGQSQSNNIAVLSTLNYPWNARNC